MSEYKKSVVITGCSHGFGFISAKRFADENYLVFAAIRHTKDANQRAKSELEAYSDNIKVIDMDVANDFSVSRAITTIYQQTDAIDILINNAGTTCMGISEAISLAQAKKQMEVNYFGALRTIQAVLPVMRRVGRGLIINTTAISGRIAMPFFATYNATKYALEGYSETLHYELAPYGIDVAIVEPGPFSTNLFNAMELEEYSAIVAQYDDLEKKQIKMRASSFEDFIKNHAKTDPNLVVQAYFSLAEMGQGQRPIRTVVGIDYGIDKLNAVSEVVQNELRQALQIERSA